MKISVEVKDVRELLDAAGVTIGTLARRLGLSESMTSMKLKGTRPFFLDEVGGIVGAVEEGGRTAVTEKQVVELVGRGNMKIRGYLG